MILKLMVRFKCVTPGWLKWQPGRRKATKMGGTDSRGKGYVLAALLGAIGGGLVVGSPLELFPRLCPT